MSRIATAFKQKALIAYVTVGYPSVQTTLEVVPALAQWGCDIVELGIPFSDPLADGATIQEASYSALQNGVTPSVCLDTASRLRREVDVPLVFMTYYNPVLRFGLEGFCQASAKAGVDGLIVPDLPVEEGGMLGGFADKSGLDLIYLLAPTSSDQRIELVAQRSRGFVYLVSVTGVTGARRALPTDLAGFVSRVRQKTDLPLCVGFGISTAKQAREVAQVADGVIVGSRIVQLLRDEKSRQKLQSFIKGLKGAVSGA
jgi:tryptophan synthase alpha chain